MGSDESRYLVPLRLFYLVGPLDYALAAVVLYRVPIRVVLSGVHLDGRGGSLCRCSSPRMDVADGA